MIYNRFPPHSWAAGLLAASVATASVASCTSDDSPPGAGTAGTAASSGTAMSSGAAPGAGSGGTANGANGGSLNLGDPGSGDTAAGGDSSSVGKDDACATSSEATRALPAVLELVVDTSGSMDWPPGWVPKSPNDSKPPGATKWEITRDALDAAVAALPPQTALGVSFYPNVEQSDDSCLMAHQSVPIELLGDKTSNARAAFLAALADVSPVGATPTHGAYRFGLTQLGAWMQPASKFVLLITDGTPTCDLACACTENNEPVDSQPLIDEAAAAFKDGVRTFVIGSPGSEGARDVLSRLSSEGGTARDGCSDAGPNYCHFDMTVEPDFTSGLAQALDEISMSVRSCEYPIPPPPAGQTLDPDRVNVLYTPAGKDSETIARDASADECREGWQYSSDGQNVVLCGDACARAQSEAGTVEILFGCETVVTAPR